MLAKVPRRQPLDDDTVLADVSTALDERAPHEEQVKESTLRLRGHLKRLADIACATDADADQTDESTTHLATRARALLSKETPSDYRQAVGLLLPMAWTAKELLERLVELPCLRESV
ncbi:DUF6415 family natural product biosynthesis protein [Streptomyces sp. NPDC002265]|uniref:DUF6415 family natural product biosynthesis protein n=1 Tax=Streptomyces sp. NPDC002265 TaxID=3154415 RepID=UPI0033253923